MNHESTSSTAFTEGGTNATQTNPFTGDLKGEFTSDFGTNTNAVSQMFRGDGGGGDKKKTIIYAIAGVVIFALLIILLLEPEDQIDGFGDPEFEDAGMEVDQQLGDKEFAAEQEGQDMKSSETADASKDAAKDKAAAAGAGAEAKDALASGAGTESAAVETSSSELGAESDSAPNEASLTEGGNNAASQMAQTGSITVNQPFDGASLEYDETQGPAVFSWTGSADRLVFARNSAMQPIVRSVTVAGRQSYRFLHPHPGRWWWRLENAEGGTAPQSFTIMSPIRRNFPITQPAPGTPLSGNGGIVAWQGDSKIARYVVQVVTQGGSWSAPQFQFGTSGTSVAIQGVPAGSYDLRVGAFSEVAGRWEWQMISGVSVQ